MTRLVARSWEEASSDLSDLSGAAVVSMGSPSSSPPWGFDTSDPAHVGFTMHDIDHVTPELRRCDRYEPPSRDHVERLLGVAPRLLDRPLVYAHCRVGVSRSTAAIYVLKCPTGRESVAFHRTLADRPQAKPNRTIVGIADDLLDRDGRMLEQLEAPWM